VQETVSGEASRDSYVKYTCVLGVVCFRSQSASLALSTAFIIELTCCAGLTLFSVNRSSPAAEIARVGDHYTVQGDSMTSRKPIRDFVCNTNLQY